MPPSPTTDFELAHTYRGDSLAHALPIPPTVLSYIDERARLQGDDPFITAVSAEKDAVTVSYGQLEALSRRMAGWLRRESQARPGDVVGLLPRNDVPSVIAIFGLLRAGCAVLFLNPADPAERLRQQAEALAAKAVLRARAVPAEVFPDALPAPDPRALDEALDAEPLPDASPLADALFFGTSGSTATSKLVAQSHYNAAVNARAVCRHHGLRRGDRFLGCLPIHHVNGLHFTLIATLAAGSHAILAHGFDPFDYARLVTQFRPRVASVVPSILEALVGTWREPSFPSEFDYFVSAAAPLTAGTARAVAERLNVRVLQGYGLTETTNFSTTMPADLSPEAYRRLALDAEIPSIGTAFYGNEVAVLRADGGRAAPGEVGEICMRGHNVMMRYAGNVAETDEAFRFGWFHSQDLGFAVEDGESGRSFFVITGRVKNIAKVRGESVSLDEMERALRALPQVLDAACAAVPHRLLGDEIIASVVLSGDVSDAELRARLRDVFAQSALPRRIVRLDAIPRTPTGKIRRPELTRLLTSLGGGNRRDG